jgi:uncharacterized protein (UPF0147 family)
MAKRTSEKPIRPEYLQEMIVQANGFKAERDQARQELKTVLRLLEDIAFNDPKNARELARKALSKLQHHIEEPLYDQNRKIKAQMSRRLDVNSHGQ